MPTETYAALKVKQTDSGSPLVLFGAPAVDIERWAGVVQRQTFGEGNETIGFQRTENPSRIESLKEFYSDERNVMQNPLLLAVRDPENCKFEPTGTDDSEIVDGTVTVTWEDIEDQSLLELLRELETQLRARLTDAGEPPDEFVARVKEHAEVDVGDSEEETDSEDDEESDEADDDRVATRDEPPVDVFFTEETHLIDFLYEIAARVQVLEELGDSFEGDVFAGFSKSAVAAYVRPVLLVDGQHRLLGAVAAARTRVDTDPEVQGVAAERMKGEGADPAQVQAELTRAFGRTLPVSLLIEPNAEEHVFQFVVVNQKATPIGRALLGTIVSTSLTIEELDRVSDRLSNAGIPLEVARAIAYLTRSEDSPFAGRVQRGLTGEGDLLPWTVLASLVTMFRALRGGKLFGQDIDYANLWARRHLVESKIVDADKFAAAKDEWGHDEGPWRSVFVRFFAAVRDELAEVDDENAYNYWGRPRTSNLFNKISLTILAADFFAFLFERALNIDDPADVDGYVKEWLDATDPSYFARDWELEGVKKDAPGTRSQWAQLWFKYRRDGRLPNVGAFRKAKGA